MRLAAKALVLGSLVACGPGGEPPRVPPLTTSTMPAAPAGAIAPKATAPGGAGYAGHGAESLPPEVLARYAPTPLAGRREPPHPGDARRAGARRRADRARRQLAVLCMDRHRHRAGLEGRRPAPLPAAAHRRRGRHARRGHPPRRQDRSSSRATARARRTPASTCSRPTAARSARCSTSRRCRRSSSS